MKKIDPTIYGFDHDELLLFAYACREAGVENEDLKAFSNNIQFAFDVVWRDMERVHQQIVNDALYELREEKLNV